MKYFVSVAILILAVCLYYQLIQNRVMEVSIPSEIQVVEVDVREKLFTYLRASRHWRIGRHGGNEYEAELREDYANLLAKEPAGRRMACGCRIFFANSPDSALPQRLFKDTCVVGTSNRLAKVNILPSSQNDYCSRLTLNCGEGIFVDIRESSTQYERQATGKVLQMVAEMLRLAQSASADIEQTLLLDKSMRMDCGSDPLPRVQDVRVQNTRHTYYKINGYVNTGSSEPINLRFFEAASKEPRQHFSDIQTLEWPGWSHDPRQLFYFETDFYIAGEFNGEEDFIIELYSGSKDAGMALWSTNICLKTWTR